MTQVNRTIVADIAGGTKPLDRDIGTNLTIQHLWSMYRWYPGFRDMINLEVDAIFSNGLNENDAIDTTRLMEFKESVRWALMAGYATIVVDARDPERRKVEAWHPQIDGIGFQFTSFSKKGDPLSIDVYVNANETAAGEIKFSIPHYPCKVDAEGEYIEDEPLPNEYGFFHVRTQGNIRGIQGLPQYMHLIDPFKIQWDIIKAYGPYAEKQGMAFPVFGLAENTKANRANLKTQFANQPTTNRMLMVAAEDAVEWISPQAGAYDPFPMLQWLNSVIARSTQMNKLMLEGDPAGYLSASETSINNWEAKLGEKQTYWKTQFLGAWKALGASDDINFQDAAKPTFISLMTGLKEMREAMDGLVSKEDIVNLMNVYLEKNDQGVELHVAEDGEWETNNMEDDKNDQDTSSKDNE